MRTIMKECTIPKTCSKINGTECEAYVPMMVWNGAHGCPFKKLHVPRESTDKKRVGQQKQKKKKKNP